MYKTVLFFYCCCFAFTSTAQNLLLNGDFEEYWECPTSGSQTNRCKFMMNPCDSLPNSYGYPTSTPDFFNCSYYYPYGIGDYVKPKSGKGYAGIYLSLNYSPLYGEYLQLKLSKPMKINEKYFFSFYSYLIDNGITYTSSSIGVKFVTDSVVYNKYLWEFMDADWENPSDNYFKPSSWLQHSGSYVAKGGEQWMIIGNFADTSRMTCKIINSPFNVCEYNFYLCIDDCIVEPFFSLPNIFTPNNDGINDVWQPVRIIEENQKVLEVKIYNRWGKVVFEAGNNFEEWDGNCNGTPCSEGVYFASVILQNNNSIKKLSGNITLLR